MSSAVDEDVEGKLLDAFPNLRFGTVVVIYIDVVVDDLAVAACVEGKGDAKTNENLPLIFLRSEKCWKLADHYS
eukprot:1159904-Amphidinium_carterae.1